MAVIELPQYRPAFDASRLRLLDRGTHTLVMDRVSGHWLTIESESVPLVQLVATRDELLPEPVRVPVADLRALLLEHGVGATGGERHFGGLNTVILKLTNACNLACSYCYDFESFERATVLPVEMATRALDEALELVESELWVILHGGEPMLLWDTIEAIVLEGERLSDKHGKRINFVGQTNLSRLNDRVVGFSTEHA